MIGRIQALEDERENKSSISKISAEELESTVNDMRRKLEESESAKANLQSYINHLKSSYQSVFAGNGNGGATTSNTDENEPTSVSSSQPPSTPLDKQ